MKTADELWTQIHRALEHHRKAEDCDTQATLDRLSKEWAGDALLPSFNATTCTVKEEAIPVQELKNLEVRHQRARPERLDGPIVVLRVGGRRMAIDGNTRANAWKLGRDGGPFNAIVIEPREQKSRGQTKV